MDSGGARARFNELYANAKESARQRSLQNVQIQNRRELLGLINRVEFLSNAEKSSLEASLKFSRRKLLNEMIPTKSISFVRDKVILTPKVIDQLYATGQNIFPIVHNNLDDCIGVIYLDEVSEVAKGEQSLRDIAHLKPPVITSEASLNDALEVLMNSGHQVVFISKGNRIIGMIELKKILNLLLGK